MNHPADADSQGPTAETDRREAALDETIEQSFPASDPPPVIQIPTLTTSSHRRRQTWAVVLKKETV